MERKEPTNKQMREQREFQTKFSDPKTARQAWSSEIIKRYSMPVLAPLIVTDKDGVMTAQSQVEQFIYNSLVAEIKASGQDRLPTEGEFMEACQSYYARHNSASYVARRDSMGAKPVDESKSEINTNPLFDCSDEELEAALAAMEAVRAKKVAAEEDDDETESEIQD